MTASMHTPNNTTSNSPSNISSTAPSTVPLVAPISEPALAQAHHDASNPVQGLIVMDIDATVIDEEVIDQLALQAGVFDQVAPITARAMRGELDFEQALRERVALLKGLPSSIFTQVYRTLHPTYGVRELITTAHRHGFKVGVVSGGFHEVADMLVEDLQIDICYANRLEVQDGVLTGKLLGEIVTKTRKLETLRSWAQQCGLDMSRTVAIGDGANDIPMITAAGVGIAFCAKPKTRKAAPYAIDTRDLMLAWEIITKHLPLEQ